ncbi:MAG: epoxyqueuosine reductase [Deltaproteobacteria bacterium]|nr:epoxyqueuosine reductase [Deltaproteobacteria bacterium]
MERVIRDEIRRFVLESPDNRFPHIDRPYFEEPLIGFAAADDPMFNEFKSVIGLFHVTPEEIMENCYGDGIGEAKTVICWILPISRTTRESNRKEMRLPSREWALTRAHGEHFNTLLRMHLVEMLWFVGARGVAPLLSGMWRPVMDSRVGMASTWSERHAAYVAGLGTFSLNDGFITEKGIAHRCGSVITDVSIPPTRRTCSDPWSNCLFLRDGSCGFCIGRCPAGAISRRGHDKERCKAYVYGELRARAGELYGVMETGCGLCQTGVPCEACVPVGEENAVT